MSEPEFLRPWAAHCAAVRSMAALTVSATNAENELIRMYNEYLSALWTQSKDTNEKRRAAVALLSTAVFASLVHNDVAREVAAAAEGAARALAENGGGGGVARLPRADPQQPGVAAADAPPQNGFEGVLRGFIRPDVPGAVARVMGELQLGAVSAATLTVLHRMTEEMHQQNRVLYALLSKKREPDGPAVGEAQTRKQRGSFRGGRSALKKALPVAMSLMVTKSCFVENWEDDDNKGCQVLRALVDFDTGDCTSAVADAMVHRAIRNKRSDLANMVYQHVEEALEAKMPRYQSRDEDASACPCSFVPAWLTRSRAVNNFKGLAILYADAPRSRWTRAVAGWAAQGRGGRNDFQRARPAGLHVHFGASHPLCQVPRAWQQRALHGLGGGFLPHDGSTVVGALAPVVLTRLWCRWVRRARPRS